MGQINITYLSGENENAFFAIAAEYLPDSEEEKMRQRVKQYPKAFVALAAGGELAGVAFGWPRKLDAPEDSSFTLDGIAVKETLQRNGYGKILLGAFEKAAKEYGYSCISVGSAGGYVEKFYIDNGFVPIEYKICTDNGIELFHEFTDLEDYLSYKRPNVDGFVVLEKRLGE